MKTSILIVEELTLFREALQLMLSAEKRIQVIGTCSSWQQALKHAAAEKPDVILINSNILKQEEQDLPVFVREKMLCMLQGSNSGTAREMITRGIRGLITKEAGKSELLEGILAMGATGNFLSEAVRELLEPVQSASDFDTLTDREKEVCSYISKGHTSKEIAAELMVSTKTVQTHRYNILRKLKLPNRAALVDSFHAYSVG